MAGWQSCRGSQADVRLLSPSFPVEPHKATNALQYTHSSGRANLQISVPFTSDDKSRVNRFVCALCAYMCVCEYVCACLSAFKAPSGPFCTASYWFISTLMNNKCMHALSTHTHALSQHRRVELMRGPNASRVAKQGIVPVGTGHHVVDPTLLFSNWRSGAR